MPTHQIVAYPLNFHADNKPKSMDSFTHYQSDPKLGLVLIVHQHSKQWSLQEGYLRPIQIKEKIAHTLSARDNRSWRLVGLCG